MDRLHRNTGESGKGKLVGEDIDLGNAVIRCQIYHRIILDVEYQRSVFPNEVAEVADLAHRHDLTARFDQVDHGILVYHNQNIAEWVIAYEFYPDVTQSINFGKKRVESSSLSSSG